MAATVDVSGEFLTFLNFEKRKEKPNRLMSFSKIVHLRGYLGQIKKN